MRYRLRTDAVIEGEDFADALRRIGEHFIAWSQDTPADDPDTWRADASLTAPHFEVGAVVHLTPVDVHVIPQGFVHGFPQLVLGGVLVVGGSCR